MNIESLLFLFLICFLSTGMGRVSGAGGGVLIKPALDVSSAFSIPATSLLSSFSVWSMTACTLVRLRKNPISVQWNRTIPLSAGAALGGSLGHLLFAKAIQQFPHMEQVGQIQNACLLILMFLIAFSLYRNWKYSKPFGLLFCILLGILLGTLSAFLGIGGGPLNVAALTLFLSMQPKEAALHSLLIIFFAQTINLIPYVFESNLPVQPLLLPIAGTAGILGATCGEWVSNRLPAKRVRQLFTLILLFVGILALINFIKLGN